MRKTKIVATLGPASGEEKTMRELLLAGANVVRFNFSHGDHDEQLKRVLMAKKLRAELNMPLALLADTRGPEIRTGLVKDGPIMLQKGQTLTLTTQECEGTAERIGISYDELPRDVKAGDQILLDDGLIALTVERTDSQNIYTMVMNSGKINSRKGINVPNVKLHMPFLSQQDKKDLQFAVDNDFDYVAASFTRNAADIRALREALHDMGGDRLRIIAKIENAEGIAEVDDIFDAADGIMVARGDMGVEVALEELPIIQKKLIRKGLYWGKPVITATQMLDSMTQNPRPTRAEVTDVANAIYDNTSAIMLSGETASGLYPVETVQTMVRIAKCTEAGYVPVKHTRNIVTDQNTMIANAISHSTCTTATDLNAKAIITITKSGETAQHIAKHRPDCMIIGCTPVEKTYHQMALFWGVRPVMTTIVDTSEQLMANAVKAAQDAGYVKDGDLVVLTAGLPLHAQGGPATNMQRVHIVGAPI